MAYQLLKKIRVHKGQVFLYVLSIFAFSFTANARPPEEPEFQAARVIGERVADWVNDLEKRPYSVAIYNVHSNYPLEQDYATVVETEVLKGLKDKNFEKVSSCGECRIPHVAVADDKVIVTKGAFDVETLKTVGRKVPVETFLVLEIFRTKLSVIAEVSLYQNGSGNLISAERFKIPSMNFVDAAAQFMFVLGPGKELGGATTTGYATAINTLLLEDIGFAKAGLNLGGVFGGAHSIFYLNPTLSLRGRFGNSYLGYAISPGVGYGFASGGKGITFRGAFDMFLGSTAVLGFEGIYFLPDQTGANTFSSYAGFHVGIAFGR